MEKLLFIVPPYVSFERFINPSYNERVIIKKSGNYASLVTDMPIGLLSISAYLKKHSQAQIRLIDFNIILNEIDIFTHSNFKELFLEVISRKQWLDFAPTILGISVLFSPSYKNMLDIAQAARSLFPDALIVAGGGVPTNMYSQIFKDSSHFDGLCYGEGERPLLELVRAIDKRALFKEHRSWITREKAEDNQAFKHDFIGDLDEIPFYDYSLCEPGEYGLNPAITAYNAGENSCVQTFYVMTSRGCSHRCCFCSSHTVHGRRMRYHSLDRINEDFSRLKAEFNAKTYVFQDDHLMADKQRFLEIVKIIKKLNVEIIFQNSLALYALERKILEALKSAGVNQLVLSVESGSDRVLKKIMHKPLNLSIVKRVVNDCRQLGIYTNVNILIGLPGETKQDIEDSRLFLKTIPANWFIIFCAAPLVGSEMYEVCIRKKYLKGGYIDCDYKKAIIETGDFSAEYIQEKSYSLNLELNFLENNDLRTGDFQTALKGFQHTIAVKNDHAFAFYFAAKCCKLMNLEEKYQLYKTKYQEIIAESGFWKGYVEQFALSMLE